MLRHAFELALGRLMGLNGIAYAGLVAGALTSLPAGLWLLKPVTFITPAAAGNSPCPKISTKPTSAAAITHICWTR